MNSKENFIRLAKDLLKDCPMDCFMETEFTGEANQEMWAQLYWSKNDQYMEFTYTPELAPCREVLVHGEYMHLDNVFECFPKDRGLETINAQCYLGLMKKDQSGHLALLGPQALTESQAQAFIHLLKQS